MSHTMYHALLYICAVHSTPDEIMHPIDRKNFLRRRPKHMRLPVGMVIEHLLQQQLTKVFHIRTLKQKKIAK